MLDFVRKYFSKVENDKETSRLKTIHFDESTIADKVKICELSIKESHLPQEVKDTLKIYLEESVEAENPNNFDYSYLQEISGKKIPTNIKNMFNKIYSEVVPTKGKEKALDTFDYAYKHWQYASDHRESGDALFTALFSLGQAIDYLIESNLGADQEFYKKVGDCFFNTTIQLKEIGKKDESEISIRQAMKYYEQGKIVIPSDIKENWEKYSYNEVENLRTDWQTTNNDLLKLVSVYK